MHKLALVDTRTFFDDTLVIFGKIISHAFILCSYLPPAISPVVYVLTCSGYGKSLAYQMYLPLMQRFKTNPKDTPSNVKDMLDILDVNEKVLVCCFLVSLMNDQVERLSSVPGLQSGFKVNFSRNMAKMASGNLILDTFFTP